MQQILKNFTIIKLCSLYLFIVTINYVASDDSVEDCKSLGFNKLNLLCSTCDKFTNGLESLRDNCKECCVKDKDDTKRYPKAVLEVCTCKFGAYPQIQAFIKSDRPQKFKNLQIKYVRGLDPVIKLYSADDKVKDVLDIHKWNTDSVDEFLQTHLIMD